MGIKSLHATGKEVADFVREYIHTFATLKDSTLIALHIGLARIGKELRAIKTALPKCEMVVTH
jgi:hypothetical protein